MLVGICYPQFVGQAANSMDRGHDFFPSSSLITGTKATYLTVSISSERTFIFLRCERCHFSAALQQKSVHDAN